MNMFLIDILLLVILLCISIICIFNYLSYLSIKRTYDELVKYVNSTGNDNNSNDINNHANVTNDTQLILENNKN